MAKTSLGTQRNASSKRRPYRSRVQAEVAALTRNRILAAALALVGEVWLDDLTFERIAHRAEVTVQTIIRHFGTKERRFATVGETEHRRAVQQRAETPAGDLAAAVRTLMAHYEEVGDRVLRLLAQEERFPALHALLASGRGRHREWVERVFAPFLPRRAGPRRARLLAQLTAVTDVYVWRLLRRDSGLGREATEVALQDLLSALVGERAGG